MATPKKLPSGKWNVTVFSHMENGKRKYVSFTAPTKTEANRLAAEFQSNKTDSSQPMNLTIGQAADKYLQSKSNVLSPSTYRSYKCNRNNLKPIENIKLGSITSYDIQDFINEFSKTHKSKTVRNLYGLLSATLGMFMDKNFKITLPQKGVVERHIPTDNDVKNLLDNASPHLKVAIALAGIGTLRRSEICALKYKDVYPETNEIYVHAAYVKGADGWVYKKLTKKDSSTRRIELPKNVIELIGEGNPEDFIYPYKPANLTDTFKSLRDHLELECRFHDLRHYAASILHAIGVPDQYIMEKGGWSSDHVLKTIYRNSLSDKSSEFNMKANKYFDTKLDLSNNEKKDTN